MACHPKRRPFYPGEDELKWVGKGETRHCKVKLFINPLRAKFFSGNINIYLLFVSFLHIDTTQVVEIFPQIRQEPTYST